MIRTALTYTVPAAPLPARAGQDISDENLQSMHGSKPVEVVRNVVSAIGATARPTCGNAGHTDTLSLIVTGDRVIVVDGGADARPDTFEEPATGSPDIVFTEMEFD